MRVLVLHNAYQQRGGEDAVVEAEAGLLRAAGHEVTVDIISNDAIVGLASRTRAFLDVTGNRQSAARVARLVGETGADVVHIHNFFPRLSPLAHLAAADRGAAVVQTLHNYRLMCAAATFLRDGRVCQDCKGGSSLPALRHRCYRGSLPGTLGVVRMQNATLGAPRWRNAVHRFIVLTEFARRQFAEGGLPADRLAVKPNFTFAPPTAGAAGSAPRSGALFVGRLSEEKGVRDLVSAWAALPGIPLTIVGDGPLRADLEGAAPENVTFTGWLDKDEVGRRMAGAAALVFPSRWFEGFPMVIVEALAHGLPVLAADLGAAAEIIEPGVTGDLFPPGQPGALAETVRRAFASDTALAEWSRHARARFDGNYTPERNLRQLERIYEAAMADARV